MIKFTQPVLDKLGYAHDKIIMSLENRMKCGIGMCGRCNIGKEFVCKDGPVFTLEQLNQTPASTSAGHAGLFHLPGIAGCFDRKSSRSRKVFFRIDISAAIHYKSGFKKWIAG